MKARKGRTITKVLCVLALLSTVAIPKVAATTQVDIYGYIHLDDGNSISQLPNQLITIKDDLTQTNYDVFTDQYGFFTLTLIEPIDALYTETLTLSTSYIDPNSQVLIEGSTTMILYPCMRADPTFELPSQLCDWYEDTDAMFSSLSPHSDEIVTDIYFSEEFGFEGDPVTIYADIMNIGQASLGQSASVKFYDGESLILPDDLVVPPINVDETSTVEIIWFSTGDGEHLINVGVNEERTFTEVSMTNNFESKNYIILTHWGDYDMDGLLNWDEYAGIGTSPIDPDTDNDGLPDGWEVFNDLSPLNDGRIDPIHGPNGDQDGDGLINLYEYTNSFDSDTNPSTDPWDPDTDGDGFSDYEELNGITLNGAQTSWIEQFNKGKDYDWYIERSNANNIFVLETNRYISSPFSLYIESTSSGFAYGNSPILDIDLNEDYSISFYFRLADETNDWLEVIMNGQVRLVVDSSNNLCYMYDESLTILKNLDPNQWYYIRCEVKPISFSYDVHIDENNHFYDIPFYDNSGGMYTLRFAGPIDGETSYGKAYWDDIMVKYTTQTELVITDPSDLDTDDDGLNDDIEINTYGTDPTDYDTDDDSFLPFFDFNDYIEVQYWEGDPYYCTPLDAGMRANNFDFDEDHVSDGFEAYVEFDPALHENSNVKWQLDSDDYIHMVWQEENSPYEIYYRNNVGGLGWNTEIQLANTLDPAFSVQPRVSVDDSKVNIEWMAAINDGGTWKGKWKMAETDISSDYTGNWYIMDLYKFISDDTYAREYPTEDPADSEIVFPEPLNYFVRIDPDDFGQYWTITPIDPSTWTIPWRPEPTDWPDTSELALNTPRIDEIKRVIEDFDPGRDDQIYIGPGTEGEFIYAIRDLWNTWGGIFRSQLSDITLETPGFEIRFDVDLDYDDDGLFNSEEDTDNDDEFEPEEPPFGETNETDPDTDDDNYARFYYSESGTYYTFSDGDEKSFWNDEVYTGAWRDNFDEDEHLNNLLDPDADGDGMWDGWELYWGFMPFDDGVTNYKTGGAPEEMKGPNKDFDGDGLDNIEEFSNPEEYDVDWDRDSNPTVKDTDGDGLWDGPEVKDYHIDPTETDTDYDGIDDGAELTYWGTYYWNIPFDDDGTESNLVDPDADNDGLEDGAEINIYGTSPHIADTDNDGLIDGEEVYKYGSDPLNDDSDGDWLMDGHEVHLHGTNPMDTDTDNDGLWDGHNVGSNKGEMSYGTYPTSWDSDSDGLKDGYELSYWSNNWDTNYDGDSEINNLLDRDADNDGVTDGAEIKTYGSKPYDIHSDNDGLDDGLEVLTCGSDPTLDDTDSDGWSDGYEYNHWSDYYDNHDNQANWNSDHDGDGIKNIIDWDSDGDLVDDCGDIDPAKYNNVDGSIFSYDTITVNNNIGVTVAIDYNPDSTINPVITPIISDTTLNAGIPKIFDISTTATQSFNAIIKVLYSSPLPNNVHENHLRMYKWDDFSDKWKIESNTGVEVNNEYFWSKVSEFSTRQGGDEEEEDSDGDELTDWQEENGFSTDGYYYNGNIHGNTFIFKTNQNDPDTDNDGCNDNLDPIPLDYDMDGDGLLNAPYATMGYSQEQIYIGGDIDINSDDPDMDGDNINDNTDDDDDNDGMSDTYELSYGVSNSGWQNPYKHNARYAMLIGGGDLDNDKNWPCFWTDTKEMYNILVNQYNYNPEDIYLHFWDHERGPKDNIYIDGPADWDIPNEDNQELWGNGIMQNLEELEAKITTNDLFYIFVNSHGGKDNKKEKGEGFFQVYNKETENNYFIYYACSEMPNSLHYYLDNLDYARMVLVFSACASGTAIKGTNDNPEWNLKSENRIIITSTDKNEGAFCWAGNEHTGDDDYDHYEFLWNEDGCGFVRKLKGSGTISLKTAYNSGYNAAGDDDWEIIGGPCDTSTPQLYEWTTNMAIYTYL